MDVKVTSHLSDILAAEEQAKMRALEIIGMQAEAYAKALCPVDTGNLRNSISHQVANSNEVHIGTNVEYAPFVELGTSKMNSRPYLRPAVADHLDEYKSVVESELRSS